MTRRRVNAPGANPRRSSRDTPGTEVPAVMAESIEPDARVARLEAQLDQARSAIVSTRELLTNVGADFRTFWWRRIRRTLGRPGDPMPWERRS